MNGETDEEIRGALSNFEPSRSGLILALKGWQEETRPVCDLDTETLERLIEDEIGGFLRLAMARYDREARREFSDQLIIELAEVPLSLVAPALAEARRKLSYPEKLVPFIFDFIEARWAKLKSEGECLTKLVELAG